MLPHLASRIFGTPLLVHRAKLDVILSALGPRLGIDSPIPADATELLAAVPAPRPNMQGTVGIAVIPIHGTLVKRTLGLEAASGLTSYQDIGAMLDTALADPSVTGILLDVDSPGGEASGKLYALAPAATDGTETAVSVLATDTDATLIDRDDAIAVARHAIVARNALIWPAGITAPQKAAAEAQLVALGILVRDAA